MTATATDLRSYLNERRLLVEDHLRLVLELVSSAPPVLVDAMSYSLLAGGKRLRPLLVILAAEASGGTAEDAVQAACALEMVHTYSLIHDDLPAMDDDDFRRGQPTCHRKFGEATAILAGDGLLTLAFQVLTCHYRPATAAACCRELAEGAGATGMVGGQIEDLAWEKSQTSKRPLLTPGGEHVALENIHARKTAALFRAGLRIGVWAACGERPTGPDPVLLAIMDKYGRCFGQAFQITDDLLDVEGHSLQAGKRVQKDAVRGKLTYPGLLGVDESRRRANDLCQEARMALTPLGQNGERLAELTLVLLNRTH